jgi:hypothetical protein
MSAAEIIEQIKTLPALERAEVAKFVNNLKDTDLSTPGSELAREERFRKAADKVFAEHGELLRRLAQ